MATHSSILPRESPWIEEPGRLQSMGSQRVGHDRLCTAHKNNEFYKVILANVCGKRRYRRWRELSGVRSGKIQLKLA